MRCLRLAGIVPGVVVSLAFGDPAPSLRLLTEEYPPFNMTEAGKAGGLSTEIVRELMKRAGVKSTVEVMPWIRAFNLAVLEPRTCVYSTTRTDSRGPLFKWVGPLVENPWVLYARAGSAHAVTGLEGARPYKIGGYGGDAVSQFLVERGFEVDLTHTDVQNIRKLQAGRIDFWATGKYLGAYLVAREKATGLSPVLTFNSTFMYLACHRSLPDSQVRDLNGILHAMQKDGTLARINAKYLDHR
ncbi:substrate-binding periplasmic protein [Paludibacterium paludis]|uniref:Solute-binding protein family 3/N-terminal domain-containing protein n=1 Tax=Paludibacterium paludis TaxID=1225769 RepID=A0A918NXP4_9NEIS|nr:ABC transporter substrate-binding protein [Paludibacterium paludis]GGY02676.1 hypothetical protein GCM10011289_01020 [Paludibacterium paludis]